MIKNAANFWILKMIMRNKHFSLTKLNIHTYVYIKKKIQTHLSKQILESKI